MDGVKRAAPARAPEAVPATDKSAMLYSIKLTSHINPRQGYAPYPRFDREVWALLLAHAAEVTDVSLFANSYLCAPARRRGERGERISRRITRLGSFERFDDRLFRDVRGWTNGGGHLSVLYRVPAIAELLPRLVGLYPRGRARGDEWRDDLGLKRDETDELRDFAALSAPEHVVVAFASNADPCYIFSFSSDALDLVLDCALLLGEPTLADESFTPPALT